MGKGCRPRPYTVSKETFDSNFEQIFGKKTKASVKEEVPTVLTAVKKDKIQLDLDFKKPRQ